MNFLENLPGGRAGEANRSDPQSGVSRQIPVNVPVPVPVPEIPVFYVSFWRPGLRGQLPAARDLGSRRKVEHRPTNLETTGGGEREPEHGEKRAGDRARARSRGSAATDVDEDSPTSPLRICTKQE